VINDTSSNNMIIKKYIFRKFHFYSSGLGLLLQLF